MYSLCLTNAKCIRLVTYNTSALSIIRVKENSAYIEKSIRIRIKTIQVCGNKVFVLSTDNQIICYSFHENKKRTAIYYKENILELNHHHQVSALNLQIWNFQIFFRGIGIVDMTDDYSSVIWLLIYAAKIKVVIVNNDYVPNTF